MRATLLAFVLIGTTSALAQENPERKAVDQAVYASLRTVINYGADLYNNRDSAGCYHVFRTACVMTEPMLDHRPELQKAIREAMSEAEKNPDMAKRSWVLRRALDQVRTAVKPGIKIEEKKEEKKEEPKLELKKEEPKPEEKKEEKPQTLWERLGGEAVVTKIANDWFEQAANDPKVNVSRNGQFQPTPDQIDTIKKHLVAQISSFSGGPLKYTGRDMKTAHKGMAITNEEFDAAVANLKQVLESHKVNADAAKELLKVVEATRKDIVEK